MSVFEVPTTRTLARVLRSQLTPADSVQLVLGTGADPPSASLAYANIVIGGTTYQVPKLKGAPQPAAGAPAYLLGSADFLLYIGTVSLTA